MVQIVNHHIHIVYATIQLGSSQLLGNGQFRYRHVSQIFILCWFWHNIDIIANITTFVKPPTPLFNGPSVGVVTNRTWDPD